MCIKELGLEVDMRQIDMYKKAEHTQSWFVKVGGPVLTFQYNLKMVQNGVSSFISEATKWNVRCEAKIGATRSWIGR